MNDNLELKSLVYEGFPSLSAEAYPDPHPQLLRVTKIHSAVYLTLHQIGGEYETSEEMVDRVIDTCVERLTENSLLVIRQYFGFLALENLLKVTEKEHIHAPFDQTLEHLYANLFQRCKRMDMTAGETACAYFTCAHLLAINRVSDVHISPFAREFDPYISYHPFVYLHLMYRYRYGYSDTKTEDILNAWSEWRREHVKYITFCLTKNSSSEMVHLYH